MPEPVRDCRDVAAVRALRPRKVQAGFRRWFSAADRDGDALRLDFVAGGEFLDDRIRFETSPLDHRQRCERVLQKSISRQLNEPSMEAGVWPCGVDRSNETLAGGRTFVTRA